MLVDAFDHVGDVKEDVGVGEGGFAEVEHTLLEFVLRFEDARSVGENDLVVVGVYDTEDSVSCCLRLRSDNR